jgi:cell wall-associated NlpC family hydrolase
MKGAKKKISLDKDTLLNEAEKFLGAPYLWGGRSFFGIDCSGFVQTIVRRFGVELPRDTKDQIKCGEEIKRDQIHLGDLLFFPRHVALAISKMDFIHSSSSNGGVAFNSLDPANKIYSRHLDESFKTARRIFE